MGCNGITLARLQEKGEGREMEGEVQQQEEIIVEVRYELYLLYHSQWSTSSYGAH